MYSKFCSNSRISFHEALAVSTALSAACVAVLYLPFNVGNRDNPRIIFRRTLSLAIVACFGELHLKTCPIPPISGYKVIHWAAGAFAAILLTSLLYAGHALVRVKSSYDEYPTGSDVQEPHSHWIAFRNYLAGPVTEEIIFRRQMMSLWSCAPSPWNICICALMFSIAHIHHWKRVGLITVALQLLYTFIFGAYACLLYVNTCSLSAPITAHIMCNYIGLPDFAAILRNDRSRDIIVLYAMAILLFVFGFRSITAVVGGCKY